MPLTVTTADQTFDNLEGVSEPLNEMTACKVTIILDDPNNAGVQPLIAVDYCKKGDGAYSRSRSQTVLTGAELGAFFASHPDLYNTVKVATYDAIKTAENIEGTVS